MIAGLAEINRARGPALARMQVVIDSLEPVEDTKGNNGESGLLQVTNLRMIWAATENIRTNLSVGYGSVVNIHIRAAQSRLKGNTEALYVLTKFNGSRFEFIFTNLIRDSPRLFTTVQAVFRWLPASNSLSLWSGAQTRLGAAAQPDTPGGEEPLVHAHGQASARHAHGQASGEEPLVHARLHACRHAPPTHSCAERTTHQSCTGT
jgi:hypothetical protein